VLGTNDCILDGEAFEPNDGPELGVTEGNTVGVEDGSVLLDTLCLILMIDYLINSY